MPAASSNLKRCLVTGGAGFLGKHLVNQLLESGEYDVTVFDVRHPGDERVRAVVGDLRDPAQVNAAIEGMAIVFHCATAAPAAANTSNMRLMQDVNVRGTQHIVNACILHHVPHLVYTSSASVVFDGHDLIDVNESAPYAARPIDYYTQTKIEGEQLVLDANGRNGLSVVALRPSGIFGEGDPLLMPIAVKNARKGKLKYIVGNGRNLMDFTYVGNVAQAHVQVAKALVAKHDVAGRPFFITNAEPRLFWGFMGDLVEPLGYPRPSVHLPWRLLYAVAVIFEILVWLVKPFITIQPSEFTPMRIRIASATRQLNCGAATRAFGYVPKVSIDEGIARTVKYFAHLSAHAPAHS